MRKFVVILIFGEKVCFYKVSKKDIKERIKI